MPLEVEIEYERGVPVYRQIVEAVLAALSTRRLAGDEQLPTIHELADRLDVNPNTVARAYRELERSGHIVARRGRGTFAAPLPPASTDTVDREAVLRDIYRRAITEGARHAIGAREIVRYFRRAAHEPDT
jgi:GntR family transcriptional regulator